MNATVRRIVALAACLLAGIVTICWRTETRAANSGDPKATATHLDQPERKAANSWDQRAAAAYLDQRADWWMEWPKGARSRNLLRLVSHSGALRALAACSASRACRRSSLRERTQTPGQCHKAS